MSMDMTTSFSFLWSKVLSKKLLCGLLSVWHYLAEKRQGCGANFSGTVSHHTVESSHTAPIMWIIVFDSLLTEKMWANKFLFPFHKNSIIN